MKAAFVCEDTPTFERVYAPATVDRLCALAGAEKTVYNREKILAEPEKFADTRYLFSTWGMPRLTEEEIARCLPRLEAVFYGAGSVQDFARPFLNRGIKVFSAWGANGVPVAECTVAEIVLANKGFFYRARAAKKGDRVSGRSGYPGNFDTKVGIIGAGMIGKMVIRMLKSYRLQVLVFDPFLPEETAKELGVEKTGLERLFRECSVVSNHLANNEQTKGMLTGAHFASMRPYATFLNTGRGAQVVEPELIAVLESRPDLTAVLDVTFPEPPVEGSPFYTLENVILTPHIAGSDGNEVHRMSEYMLEEFERFTGGLPTRYEVTVPMLETMA